MINESIIKWQVFEPTLNERFQTACLNLGIEMWKTGKTLF